MNKKFIRNRIIEDRIYSGQGVNNNARRRSGKPAIRFAQLAKLEAKTETGRWTRNRTRKQKKEFCDNYRKEVKERREETRALKLIKEIDIKPMLLRIARGNGKSGQALKTITDHIEGGGVLKSTDKICRHSMNKYKTCFYSTGEHCELYEVRKDRINYNCSASLEHEEESNIIFMGVDLASEPKEQKKTLLQKIKAFIVSIFKV